MLFIPDCHSVVVTPTGSSIVTGWSDGKIRSFYPETGRMKFVEGNAHDKVTALACADDDSRYFIVFALFFLIFQ